MCGILECFNTSTELEENNNKVNMLCNERFLILVTKFLPGYFCNSNNEFIRYFYPK